KATPKEQAQATGRPTATVLMTNHGYSPRVLKIHQGQTVEFVNDSNEDYWPASDPHPTHTDYPGFDAGTSVLPGGSWKFTFNRAGRYGYHNHLAHETHAVVVISRKASEPSRRRSGIGTSDGRERTSCTPRAAARGSSSTYPRSSRSRRCST